MDENGARPSTPDSPPLTERPFRKIYDEVPDWYVENSSFLPLLEAACDVEQT